MGALQLGFTGGEPLLRGDLEELVGEADRLGYYTNLITSGVGLTEQRLLALKAAGLKQIQLSLQSSDRELTDRPVGAKAFDLKIRVARLIKAHGFRWCSTFRCSATTRDQTAEILARPRTSAWTWSSPTSSTTTGRCSTATSCCPRASSWSAPSGPCRPRASALGDRDDHFCHSGLLRRAPQGLHERLGAIHLTIAPDGAALPCQEARLMPGPAFPTVREHSLRWLWDESPTFRKFRGLDWMREPCSSCSERHTGISAAAAAALLLTGDACNTDPACSKSPHHGGSRRRSRAPPIRAGRRCR